MANLCINGVKEVQFITVDDDLTQTVAWSYPTDYRKTLRYVAKQMVPPENLR